MKHDVSLLKLQPGATPEPGQMLPVAEYDALGTLNVTHHVHTNYIGSMKDECSICHAMRWTFEKKKHLL